MKKSVVIVSAIFLAVIAFPFVVIKMILKK